MTTELNTLKRGFEDGKWARYHRAVFDLTISKRQRTFAISVYVNLTSRTDNQTQICFPSETTISRETGISLRKVVETIRLLEHLRMIVVTRTRVGNKKRNSYLLTDPRHWLTSAFRARDARTEVQGVHMNKTHGNKKEYSYARDALVKQMNQTVRINPP